MDNAYRPKMQADLETRSVDDDVFVYDPVADRVVHLNVSSAFVFHLCDGRLTVSDIVREVAEAFQVEEEEVSADVERTIVDMSSRGLLVQGPRRSPEPSE